VVEREKRKEMLAVYKENRRMKEAWDPKWENVVYEINPEKWSKLQMNEMKKGKANKMRTQHT